MGIDFAAEGLLDGLEGDDRATRLELLEQLSADGISLDELRAATRDGRLLFVGAERMISGIPRYSTRQVSERAGVSPEFVMALRRANGLPVPDIDAVVLNTEIAEHLVITEATAKSHLGRVLTKLEARDRVQLVLFAYANGLVTAADSGPHPPMPR